MYIYLDQHLFLLFWNIRNAYAFSFFISSNRSSLWWRSATIDPQQPAQFFNNWIVFSPIKKLTQIARGNFIFCSFHLISALFRDPPHNPGSVWIERGRFSGSCRRRKQIMCFLLLILLIVCFTVFWVQWNMNHSDLSVFLVYHVCLRRPENCQGNALKLSCLKWFT